MNTTLPTPTAGAARSAGKRSARGSRRRIVDCALLQRRSEGSGQVIPELDGRLTGYSLRVPVPVVSIVDLTVTLERDDGRRGEQCFSRSRRSGTSERDPGYSDEPLVSSDYCGDPRSSIIDGLSTLVIGGNMVKILAWYDNEWGFSNRLVDLALMMAKRES